MKILYISTLCSELKFMEIFDNSDVKPQQQAQKFHKLLSEGMQEFVESIYFLSRPPVNSSTKNVNRLGEIEVLKSTTYQYLKVSNNLLTRHINLFFSSFYNAAKWILNGNKDEGIIICDVLNLSISVPALLASKLWGLKSIAIITDLPEYLIYTDRKEIVVKKIVSILYKRLSSYFLKSYDYYVLLTEEMNRIVNPKNKPYIVIEGFVDIGMEGVSNEWEEKNKKNIVMYSGALHEKYGIRSLIEAFIRVKNPDASLWLFGAGDMVSEIKNYEKMDRRIKYFGVVNNYEVVRKQLKATILVNPRPVNEDYAKYSFPSKNMEYMASGTPILTTDLSGMPGEYKSHVFLIEDDTIDGIEKALNIVLKKERSELHNKGTKAKDFVLKNKNNFIQAKKIFDMLTQN